MTITYSYKKLGLKFKNYLNKKSQIEERKFKVIYNKKD